MSILIKRSCALALAMPVAALAAPVTVTTHSSGTSYVDNTVLNALGLDSVPNNAQLPYEVTMTSTFDPEDYPYISYAWGYNYTGKAVIDFRLGSQTYHYDSGADSRVFLYDQSSNLYSYNHYISFYSDGPPTSNFIVGFAHTMYGLPFSLGLEGPMTPFDADKRDGVFGYFTINAIPSYPDVPLSWTMGSTEATVSVHVAPVPAPAQFSLLAAGLLTLGLRRRFGLVPRATRKGTRHTF
jgi:hypothetical protein